MTPKSLLIFRNGSIGNTLAATPALRALRNAFPGVPMTIVLDRIGAELLRHSKLADNIIVYEKHGADRGVWCYLRLLRRLRAVRPTHAILLKRFFRNGLLARLSGARERIGFMTNGSAPFLNRTIPYAESTPVVDLNLRLVSLLGAVSDDRSYELVLSEEDRLRAEELLRDLGKANYEFIVLHYGGGTTSPDFFPIGKFAEMIGTFDKRGIQLIAIGTGVSETDGVRRLQAANPNIVAALDLPIRTTAALIERAKLFIGFNSGPAHIAAAVGTPELVIYKPDNAVENEIVKWKPISDSVQPLIPPDTTDEIKWNEFLRTATEAADRLMSAPVGRANRP